MTIRAKLTLLLFVFLSILLFSIWLISHAILKDALSAAREQDINTRYLIGRVIDLEGVGLENFTRDYACWDDMVAFARSADTSWGAETLKVALSVFALDAAWVFNSSGECIYSILSDTATESNLLEANPLPFPKDDSDGIVTNRFCQWVEETLVEYRVAEIISPSDSDSLRGGTSKGWLCAAREWNKRRLGKFSVLTGGEVSIRRYRKGDTDFVGQDSILCRTLLGKVMRDARGQGTAVLEFRTCNAFLHAMRKMNKTLLIMSSVFSVALVTLFLIVLMKMISKPMLELSASFGKNDDSVADRYSSRKDEIGRLALAVSGFIKQRSQLVEEVIRRESAEKALRRSARTLKMMGKINLLLVGAVSEDALFKDICNAVKEAGGYSLVWMGLVCDGGACINVRATSGFGGHIDKGVLDLRKEPFSSGPLMGSISSAQHFVCRNVFESNNCDWLVSEAKIHGFSSVAFLTIRRGSWIIAVIGIYSKKTDIFNDAEIKMLSVMAENIAFGITRMRALLAHKETENRALDLERQIQKIQKAGYVAQFASGIAHSFEKLLESAIKNIDLSIQTEKKNGMSQRDLDNALKSCKDAHLLAQDLAAFSKQQVLHLEPVDINLLLRQRSDAMKKAAGERTELHFALADGIRKIMGDPEMLGDALVNLVGNMANMLAADGSITVATENVIVDEDYAAVSSGLNAGEYVLLTLESEESDKEVNNVAATSQHHAETCNLYSNSGASYIAMLEGIVAQLKGVMISDQRCGFGFRYRLFFPASFSTCEQHIEKEGIRARPRARLGERVLLVDDIDSSRFLIRAMLESVGYDVVEAAYGVEAQQILQKKDVSITVVMTDIMIPGVSGLDIARQAMEEREGIKVIFMTEREEEKMIKHGLDLSSKRVLKKPFTVSKMSQTIREVLDAHATADTDTAHSADKP